MKLSYLWLKEILPGLKASPQKLADALTHVGLEIESIDELGKGLNNIVVGHVLERDKHPQADRLSLCKVSDGKEVFQVVCGAPNVTAGKKYPFAKLGAVMPNGMEIKQATIRNVASHGMLCSAKELNLSEESQGLLELPDDAPVGKAFADYYGLNDVLFEVGITPNRGDCLSHLGIAREVAALFQLKLPAALPKLPKGTFSLKKLLKVQLQDSKGCARYTSRMIRGVKIGPSPVQLAQQLSHLGIRSINNVVDATNLIMLETGHPLHAFDARFIRDGKIVIRKAGDNSTFKTLDGVERKLNPDDLVIADGQGPVALAGIMGGENSGVREDTTDLILEAAAFDPVRIRKTAQRLSLHTESSHRFERFVPPQSVADALDRLTAMIVKLAGGEISSETINLYPQKQKTVKITLRATRLASILGVKLSSKEVTGILKALNLNPKQQASGWKLSAPFYRPDLTREIDIIEEVTRYTGFDKIPSSLPRGLIKPLKESLGSLHEGAVKTFFVSRGFDETIHLSFCDATQIEKLGLNTAECIALQNPLSLDQAYLIPSLLPCFLATVIKNSHQKSHRYFEVKNIFKNNELGKQVLAGLYGGELFEKNWQGLQKTSDFFYGKSLLSDLKLPDIKFLPESGREEFHPMQCSSINSQDKCIGYIGQLHPSLLARFEINTPLYYFELDYSSVVGSWEKNQKTFKPLSDFPTVERDLALLCDKTLTHQAIISAIEKRQVAWLKNVVLFDVYEGEKVPDGKKSLGFSLVYENSERTLTDDEVNRVHFELVDNLKKDLNIELR